MGIYDEDMYTYIYIYIHTYIRYIIMMIVMILLWMVAKSESQVEIDGRHPMIYMVSTILLVVQDFATIHRMDRSWIDIETYGGISTQWIAKNIF